MKLDLLTTRTIKVNDWVEVSNVTGDISPILRNIKCTYLSLSGVSFDSDTSQELINCLEDKVQDVTFGFHGFVSLDWTVMDQYDGNGKCYKMKFFNQTKNEYYDDILSWAWAGSRRWLENQSKNFLKIKVYIPKTEDQKKDIEATERDWKTPNLYEDGCSG